MRRDVPEAGDLGGLRREVQDGVEDEVREREGPIDSGRCEIPDGDADVPAAWLRAQPPDHRGRQVDAVHRHPALRERQRDPPGADPELERPTTTG
jgi:hypothetical protein